MFHKKDNEAYENNNVDFAGEMKERCKPAKLISVAGIAVIGYVIEVSLKILTGTTTD